MSLIHPLEIARPYEPVVFRDCISASVEINRLINLADSEEIVSLACEFLLTPAPALILQRTNTGPPLEQAFDELRFNNFDYPSELLCI